MTEVRSAVTKARRWQVTVLVGVMVAGVAVGAGAGVRGVDLVIPSVARGAGAGGSFWSTTLWVYNPHAAPLDVRVALLMRGQANPEPVRVVVSLTGGETVSVADLVGDLFGLDSAAGAVRLTAPAEFLASARVFNSSGDLAESQGQLLVGLPVEAALAAGESTDIIGVSHGSLFRSNFGLVETAGQEVVVTVQVVDPSGVVTAERQYLLGPWEALQRPLGDIASGVAVDGGRVRASVFTGEGRVLAFASMIGNGSLVQDPSTLEMELPRATSDHGGGVATVVAGGGLVGGGSGEVVEVAVGAGAGIVVDDDTVAVADGGIEASMIRAGSVVTGLRVDGRTLRDEVTLTAGDGLTLSDDGQSLRLDLDQGPSAVPAQVALTVTTDDGAWTNERAVGVPYQTGDGTWRLTFNLAGRAWVPKTEVNVLITGAVFADHTAFEQPVTVFTGTGASVAVGRTVPGTSTITVSIAVGSAKSRFNISGDVELDGRPSFVP